MSKEGRKERRPVFGDRSSRKEEAGRERQRDRETRDSQCIIKREKKEQYSNFLK